MQIESSIVCKCSKEISAAPTVLMASGNGLGVFMFAQCLGSLSARDPSGTRALDPRQTPYSWSAARIRRVRRGLLIF